MEVLSLCFLARDATAGTRQLEQSLGGNPPLSQRKTFLKTHENLQLSE